MARILKLAMIALPLGLLAACSSGDKQKDGSPTTSADAPPAADDVTADAEDGADVNNAETDTQLLASSLVSSSASNTVGLASVSPGDLSTEDVGGNIHALFLPRACATALATGANSAKYTFNECIGPNGLLGVSGEVDITYTTTANSLTLNLTLTAVKLNGAELDGAATATITATGANRTMTWAATMSGQTANAKKFSHQANSTVTWAVGDKCFALSGSSDGTVRQREIKTAIEDFSRCGRGCPEAGGKITVTNVPRARTIEVDFDGTATAEFTGPGGGKTPIPLLCKP